MDDIEAINWTAMPVERKKNGPKMTAKSTRIGTEEKKIESVPRASASAPLRLLRIRLVS